MSNNNDGRNFDIPEILKEKEAPKKKSKKNIVIGIITVAFSLLVFVSVLITVFNKVEIAGETYKLNTNSVYIRDYEFKAEDIEAVSKLNKVTYIQFTNCTLPEEDLSWIPESVNEIKLNNCNLTDKHIASIDFEKVGFSAINIDGNKNVTDLSRLRDAGEKLSSLSFGGCSVSDISFVSALGNLQSLYFDSNSVEDISSLSACTKLQIVSFNANKVKNIDSLLSCSNLSEVYISSNQITNLDGLKNATELKHINVDDNMLTDITGLKNATRIDTVSIKNNGGNASLDISYLEKSVETITELILDGTIINDLTLIGKMINLNKISINNNSSVRSLEFLKNCSAIEFISVSNTGLESLSGIENMKNLYELDASGCKLTSVDPLLTLDDNPIHLNLSNNNISSLKLSDLTKVRILEIYGNPLSDVDISGVKGVKIVMDYNSNFDYSSLVGSFDLCCVIDCPEDKQAEIIGLSDGFSVMSEEEYLASEKGK